MPNSPTHSPLPWFVTGEYDIGHIDAQHEIRSVGSIHDRADLMHILRSVNADRSVTGLLEAARGVVSQWEKGEARGEPRIHKLREELEKYDSR